VYFYLCFAYCNCTVVLTVWTICQVLVLCAAFLCLSDRLMPLLYTASIVTVSVAEIIWWSWWHNKIYQYLYQYFYKIQLYNKNRPFVEHWLFYDEIMIFDDVSMTYPFNQLIKKCHFLNSDQSKIWTRLSSSSLFSAVSLLPLKIHYYNVVFSVYFFRESHN